MEHDAVKKVLGLSEEQAAAFSVAREKGEALEQAVMFFFVSLVFCVSCVFLLSFLSFLLLLSFLSFLSLLFLLKGPGAWEDSPALAALAAQPAFLNELQAIVNQWTAAVRKANKTPRLETVKFHASLQF